MEIYAWCATTPADGGEINWPEESLSEGVIADLTTLLMLYHKDIVLGAVWDFRGHRVVCAWARIVIPSRQLDITYTAGQ